MRIKVARMDETAIVEDLKVTSNFPTIKTEIQEIIAISLLKETMGLSLMQLIAEEIVATNLYIIELDGFKNDENLIH